MTLQAVLNRRMDRPGSAGPTQRFGVVDLFSGVGGFSLGAARAGFELLAAVDNDSRVAQAFRSNFPESVLVEADLTSTSGMHLLDLAGIRNRTVHGIIGGPPCQGFSWIGRRREDDARNGLFRHFFRLVAAIRPWFYVAENVVGILDKRFERLRASALSELEGYHNLEPRIVRSSDFGAPTSRERVLFFGYRPDCMGPVDAEAFAASENVEEVTVGVALRGLPRKIRVTWQTEAQGWRRLTKREEGSFWDSVYSRVPPGVGNVEALERLDSLNEVSACLGTRHTAAVVDRFAALSEGEIDRPSRAVRLSRNGLCPTIRAGTGPDRGGYQALRPIHPLEPRAITPREAARLQGFPDWFQFDATKWHSFRLIGNSVSPILAEGIMRVMHDHMPAEGSSNGK